MRNSLPILLSLTLLSACDNDPAAGKTKANASAAVEASAAPAAASAEILTVDAASSSLEFTGAKVTGKHDGKFGTISGKVQLDRKDITKSSLEFEVGISSLVVEPAKLQGHLLSADFFDVEKFPKATFVTTSIAPGGAPGTHTVTGNLDLHGVKKSISFPATVELSPEGLKASAEFAINRKDFGIVYPGMPDDLIKDEVLIRLKLAAKKG